MRMKHKPWAEPFLESHKEFVITLDNFNDNCVIFCLNNKKFVIRVETV